MYGESPNAPARPWARAADSSLDNFVGTGTLPVQERCPSKVVAGTRQSSIVGNAATGDSSGIQAARGETGQVRTCRASNSKLSCVDVIDGSQDFDVTEAGMSAGNPYSFSDNPAEGPSLQSQTGGRSRLTVVLVIVAAIVLLLMASAGILMALLLPAVTTARETVRVAVARDQLRQIGIAVHNYHADFGQLPPAFTTNAKGQPTNSWRLTLTPYLDDSDRLERWSLTEPWDAGVNSGLATPTPKVYTSPIVQDPPTETETHVFAVRHLDGMMPGASGLKFEDIADGLGQTIFAAYLPNHTTHWAAPQDISLKRLQDELGVAGSDAPCILLFADGSVRVIDAPVKPELVTSWVTRRGNEKTGI
ncbi:MAG: DUF1559 domain-containing protein [Rubripirellula sp.]